MRLNLKFSQQVLLSAAVIVVGLFTFTSRANAEFSNTPALGTVTTNGSVSAIIASSTGTYLGGSFTQVGTPMGSAIPIMTSTGLATTSTFANVTSDVYALVLDSTGGYYIGGSFTQVGTYTRNYLAHILSDGTVDTNFNPNLDNIVYTLALSPDGSTLYVGGDFTTVGGVTYNRLAAITTSNGAAVSAFNPNLNNVVRSIAISSDGTKLYVGGDFTTVGGVTYNRLAAITTSNGAAISGFNPSVTASVYTVKLTSDNSILYVGGTFTTIGVTTRNYIASVATADGTITSSFNPNLNSTVITMALSSDGSKLYFGGTFTTVGGVTYNRLAAVTTSNGTAISAFNPGVDAQVQSISLSSDDVTLYVGGYFNTVAATTRNYLASVTTSNGALVSGFNPNMSSIVQSIALSSNNSTLYTGGFFSFANGYNISNLAHVLPSGAVDSSFSTGIGSSVLSLALSPDGSKIYAAGSFTTVGVSTYNRLAAFNTTDGSVISAFNPNMGNTVNGIALSSDGATLYAGGAFTTVGGVTYNRLAAVTTSNGAAVSAFNPNVGNSIFAVALSSNNSTLYFGGQFTTVGGVTYNRLAAVTTSNGAAVSAFNPSVSSTIRAMILSSNNSTLYFGGQFTTVGVATYNRLAAVTTADGAAVSAFNPNVNNTINSLALTSDGSKLYFGGVFTTVGGVTYTRLAAATTANGTAVSEFNPNVNSTVSALAMTSDDSKLIAGGTFSSVNNSGLFKNFVRFITPPTVTTSAASSITANTATLNGAITVSNTETVRGFAYGTDSSLTTVIATTTESGSFSASSHTYAASSLTANTTYYFRAYATNAAGTGYGSITSLTTSAAGAPTLLQAEMSSVTATGASASSTITVTGGANSTHRGFVYGTDSTFATVVATTSESGSFGTGPFSASLSSLVCNTQYYIRAYASSTVTGYSSAQNFTTTACVPDAPIGVSGAAGDMQVTVSFTAPVSNGGAAITGYTVTSNPDGISNTGAASPITITGLINNVGYTFTVIATNSVGNSAPSSASGTVTPVRSSNTVSHSGGGGGGGGGSSIKKPVVVENATSTGGLGKSAEISACEPYLKSFISEDSVNDRQDVAKLQSFLIIYEKETLSITGIYDKETVAAVNRFQAKNIDILKFWGLTSPTGNVYITTKNAINKKYCEQTRGIVCPYFTQYAKTNDVGLQVTRIKNFLNKIEGETLDLTSPLFDLALTNAINRFQTKYSNRVLSPWGLNKATGNWYQSTSKQANDILGCFNPVRLDNGVVIE